MVHFWTLLFLYYFSLNELKMVFINPLQILCPINQVRYSYDTLKKLQIIYMHFLNADLRIYLIDNML